MDPAFRFTLDLIGLTASTLLLLALLIWLPPLNLRVSMAGLALVAICLGWVLSLANGLTDNNSFAIGALISISWASVCVLVSLLAAVLA